MNVNVPAARAWPNCPPEFYRFFLKVASSANETSGGAITDINNRLTAVEQSNKQQVQGFASIQTQGGSSGYLYVTLQGDVTTPGNTQYYGSDSTGKRGWFNVSDALGSASLSDLSDVATTAPTDKYVLTWDATTSTWGPALSGGLPAGGTTGQVLTKVSAADGDADWQDPSGGIASVVPGSHITVDNTDPANPVVGVSSLTSSTSYAEGTAFPTSPAPALNDKFYRTDLNLLCYFNGTRWLTVTEYDRGPDGADAVQPINSSSVLAGVARWVMGYPDGIYLTRLDVNTFSSPAGTSGTNFSFQLSARTANNTATNIGAAISTIGDGNLMHVTHGQSVNIVIAPTIKQLQLVATITGNPLTYVLPRLMYRRIIT